VFSLKGSQPFEQRAAPSKIVLPCQRLSLEVFAARLIRFLSRVIKALPVDFVILADAFAESSPLLLQAFDAIGQRDRIESRADESSSNP